MSYDIEDMLLDVKTAMTSGLNTKITAINSAKDDGITLSTVDSSAFFMQSLDNELAVYDPFVFYGVVDISTTPQGPYNANEYTIAVMLVAADDGTGEDMTRKALRYQKALQETFSDYWNSSALRNKIEINSMVPLTIEGLNASQEHRVVGVELKTTF